MKKVYDTLNTHIAGGIKRMEKGEYYRYTESLIMKSDTVLSYFFVNMPYQTIMVYIYFNFQYSTFGRGHLSVILLHDD